MPGALTYRRITRGDIEQVAVLVADAFAGYRVFAPAGWRPPTAGDQVDVLQGWIADPEFWGELALDGHTLVGHATCIPAQRAFQAAPEPAVAHLGHLFVKPQYWGTGAAGQLLTHATSAAAKSGYTVMRLFAPVGQARARRFYAREGFTATGNPFDPGIGLPVIEYRSHLVR